MKIKEYLNRDTVGVGLVTGLAAMLAYVLLLTAGLLIAGESVADHIRWYGGMFVALLLVLRYYAKKGTHLAATRTLIVLLFVSFVAFIYYLFHAHILVLK